MICRSFADPTAQRGNGLFDVAGDQGVGAMGGLEEEAAGRIEAEALALKGDVGGGDFDLAADEDVILVVLVQEDGEGVVGSAGKRAIQVLGDGGQDLVEREAAGGDGREAGDVAAEAGWGEVRVVVDVHADADEVEAVDAFAEEAGEFAAGVDDVVGPFQADGVIASKLGGGVAGGEAGDQGDLLGRKVLFGGEGEGDGEAAGGGEPAVGAAAAAGELIGGEDEGGGEKLAALAEDGGVIVGGTKAGEEVEAERFYRGAQGGEMVGGFGHGSAAVQGQFQGDRSDLCKAPLRGRVRQIGPVPGFWQMGQKWVDRPLRTRRWMGVRQRGQGRFSRA